MSTKTVGPKTVRPLPTNSAEKQLPRYNLKGYERMLSVTEHGCCRIAHVLQVSAPVDLVLQHVVPAFRMVLNRHPKMRALMSKNLDEPMTSYIQPPFTNDAEMERLVTLVYGKETQEKGQEEVRKLIEDVCNQAVDRTVQFPYFLTVHVPARQPETTGPLTLLLFSDHVFGDGYSGLIVLNDLLVSMRLLIMQSQSNSSEHGVVTSQLKEQCQELPLRPPLYDQVMGQPTFWQRRKEALINAVGKMIFPREVRKFQPVLPLREDQPDATRLPFPFNKTYCLLDSGTKENLDAALASCRQEDVTLNGAIVACLLLAHIKAKYPNAKSIPKSKLKMCLDVDYNMRSRVNEPFTELTVGANMGIAGLEPLAFQGVELSRRFWDTARWSKQLADANLNSSFSMLAGMIYCHHNLNVANESLRVNVKKSIMRDVNLSNLGRYPFPTVHQLGDLGELRVDGLHLYNSMPHIGYNAVVFVTSTDHLSYAMANRLSDKDGATLFRNIVKAIESISTIGQDETMLQACERIFADS